MKCKVFEVFYGDKPAKYPDFPVGQSWDENQFNTLYRAIEYARRWVGAYAPPGSWMGEKYECPDGLFIEIRENEVEIDFAFSLPLNVANAIDVANSYGGIDGAHHKMWVIDQMVRALLVTEEAYKDFVTEHNMGEDGPNTYEWDEGCPP